MSEYATLVVLIAIGVVSPFLVRKVRLPTVVAETLLGLLAGFIAFLLLNLLGIESLVFTPQIDFLASIGLIYLLFLMGLELDFSVILARGLKGVLRAFAFYGLALLFALGVVTALDLPRFVALIIAAVSVAIPVSTLREEGRTQTPFGQDVLVTVAVTDISTMIGFVLILRPATPTGQTTGNYLLLMIPFLFLAVYILYRLGIHLLWTRPQFFARTFKGGDRLEVGVRASFALLFTFAVLASATGAEAFLGAFMAGAMMSLVVRRGADLERKLSAAGHGFFVPVFFTSVGLKFPFAALADFGLLMIFPVIIACAFACKIAASTLFIRSHGAPESLRLGVLLSAELSLGIAGVTLAGKLNLLTPAMVAVLLLAILSMSFLGPTVYRALESAPTLAAPPRDGPPREGGILPAEAP